MSAGRGRRIVILGAGPTGLGAAHRLHELGHDDWAIYERNGHVGGLSASFVDDQGFTWDIGGHVLFSHFEYFDRAVNAVMNGDYYEHLRESWIRIMNSWVPYPFQNNIRHLPEAARQECLEGLRKRADGRREGKDFHQWMQSVFGAGIVKYFMQPYNQKVWAVPLQSMSADWISERISMVDLERIERNIAEQRDDVNWGPNNMFRFPKHGGTGAIFQGIARPFMDRIVFHKEAARVDLAERTISFADGDAAHFDVLINTSPLDQFIGACSNVPESVRLAANELVHNSGLMVGLGLAGHRVDPKCWMYFPEQNAPFYRVTNFHNYSPQNVPAGAVDRYYSFMCETSYSENRFVDKDTIIDDTVNGLLNKGMIGAVDQKSIVSRHVIDVSYSYPVPTLGRNRALGIIQPYLESRQVYSRGRFGAWRYEVGNMDHSFMQGVEAADRILNGAQEQVVAG